MEIRQLSQRTHLSEKTRDVIAIFNITSTSILKKCSYLLIKRAADIKHAEFPPIIYRY